MVESLQVILANIDWSMVESLGTLAAVFVALFGYFLTWKMDCKNRELQQKFFQEEFRPLMTIEPEANSGRFYVKNIGNRSAKNIKIKMIIPIEGELVQEHFYVLSDKYNFHPNKKMEWNWKKDKRLRDNTLIDVELDYQSLSGIEYQEKIQMRYFNNYSFE